MQHVGHAQRRRWGHALFLPVSLLLIVSAVFIVPLPVYAERPGTSLNLAECITVDDPAAGPVRGDLLLTFATFRRATLVDLLMAVGDEAVLLRPVERVIPEGVQPSDYFAQNRQVFDDAGLTAAAVGLDRAGYPAPARITGEGARVVRTLEGFPAEGVLQPGDVVVRANDRPVHTSEELRELVLNGDALQLRVHRNGDVDVVSVEPISSDIGDGPRPVIGAHLETVNPQVHLPVNVDVAAGRIGGPSAGLMIALGVYDAVADEDLVAGRRIAGTGEINAAGEVGRIGALPLKVIAAERQEANVFLVPESQAESARAALPDDSDLQVVGVEDIDDALSALRELPPMEGELEPARFRPCEQRVSAAALGGEPALAAGEDRPLFVAGMAAMIAVRGGQCRAGAGEVPCGVAT